MVRRYTFGEVTLMYNIVGNRHRFPTNDLGPLVPVTQVVICEHHGRYFVAQGLTDDLPSVFELVPSDETKLEMLQADKPH
jgi:hypothetical protein